jgi:hypothetical protein
MVPWFSELRMGLAQWLAGVALLISPREHPEAKITLGR